MINLIIGKKGSGKTKKLIEIVNDTAKTSKGNVVCIEKGNTLRFDISSAVRLTDVDEYGINGYDTYYGFLAGICAGNYDVTDIFCDATFKIIGEKDFDLITEFLERVSALAEDSNVKFTFTLSCDEKDISSKVFTFAKKL